ncbi:MAG TPA: hypothetical protein VM120_20040 [Bryobacteraceae bacterium]|nr:hypothetical protein [Bryobacteraceae bacterium]
MCFGSGHVESDQLRTFRSMAIEGLRGESEKRQREIHHLETKISRLRREHKVLWEEWQQYLGDAPDESMYGVYCDRMLSEIAEFDQDADRFKAEIAIIETVIRQKVEAERSGQNATVQLSDLAVAVGGFGAAPFAAETARTSRA